MGDGDALHRDVIESAPPTPSLRSSLVDLLGISIKIGCRVHDEASMFLKRPAREYLGEKVCRVHVSGDVADGDSTRTPQFPHL